MRTRDMVSSFTDNEKLNIIEEPKEIRNFTADRKYSDPEMEEKFCKYVGSSSLGML
jgi:hypothetical protein